MTKSAPKTHPLSKALLVAIILNALVLFGTAVFARAQLGWEYMVGMSIVLAFPLAVAVGLLRRSPEVQRREVVYLVALTVGAGGSAVAITANAYRTGADRHHAQLKEYTRLLRTLREDHAFDGVELYKSPKDIFWMRGSVATDADFSRLRSLAATCRHIRWGTRVKVRASVPGVSRGPDTMP